MAVTTAAIIASLGPDVDRPDEAGAWVVLALAFAGLRIATIDTNLASSTYVLDAIGVAVFIGGTGGAASPFLALALAGAWWAAAKGGRGAVYGLAFSLAYVVLVAPHAARDGDLAAILYQPAFVLVIGVLGDRLRVAGAGPTGDHAALNSEAYELQREHVKAGLDRAVHGGPVPVDALLTAGPLGLTATQTELIPYLMLGLSNQEIADALSVSEATVRYRLTRLYRSLGVRGRKAAAQRARELGLGALLPSTAPNPG